jgi:hypothetical protein
MVNEVDVVREEGASTIANEIDVVHEEESKMANEVVDGVHEEEACRMANEVGDGQVAGSENCGCLRRRSGGARAETGKERTDEVAAVSRGREATKKK